MLFGAFAAEALARASGLDARVAYTAGLLRPLGMMVLDRAGRGQLPWTERYTVSRWPTYSVWEGGIFGIDNCEVTAMILEEWRFPRELSAALRVHYLGRASDYENRLAALLNVAGAVADKAGRAFTGETGLWAMKPEKLQAAGVSEEDLESAQAQAETGLEAALSALAS
jgi:HD-like signal output (HDOD) protein